jgi:hypothetical protein
VTILSKTLLVLFSGKAGVGKTTAARYGLDYLANEHKLTGDLFSIASSVKAAAKTSFGWDGNKDDRGRLLLQEVGRAGRNYDKDIWIAKTFDRIATAFEFPPDFILIDDWRFINEFNYLGADSLVFKPLTIRIESPDRECLKGTPYYDDISETSLPTVLVDREVNETYFMKNMLYNYTIANVGTLDELNNSIRHTLSDEINKLAFGKRKED